MRSLFKSWILRALILMAAATAAFAQERVPFRQEELHQMLAPVALYPDALVSQILMAATYPLEVVQAARWSRANPNVKGQDAVAAVEHMDWDASVKSLTAFPQVLHMMDERLEWMERLGEAFLAQRADVMDAVQELRRRADAAGNLQSTEQMQVAREGEFITIQPPAPNVVYVPYYDPRVVYGPWWWPNYPPVYWAPPRAYYAVPPYPSSAFYWGTGIGIGAGFFFGYPDWHRRHVTVIQRPVTVINRQTVIVTPGPAPRDPVIWRHDPQHRRGVPFRNPEARVRFEQERAATGETHRAPGGHPAPPTRSGADAPGVRPPRPPVQRDDERVRQPGRPDSPVAQPQRVPQQPGEQRGERRDAPRPPVQRDDERVRQPPRPESPASQPQRFAPQSSDPRPPVRSVPPQPPVAAPPPAAAPDARGARPDSRPPAVAPARPPQAEQGQQRGGARERDDGPQRGRAGGREGRD